MPRSSVTRTMEPAGSMFFWAFALFLLSAPLYKAGNRPLPILLLELGGLGLLASLFIPGSRVSLPKTLWAALAILLIYPLIQLIPLSASLWNSAPGHSIYAPVLDRFVPGDIPVWRSLSIVPWLTEYGWLAMIPVAACLLATLRLSPEQVARLLLIMSVFAGAEALLGLLQVGSGESIFYLRNDKNLGTAIGTFVNRNHFAALLAMTLPVVVGLLVFDERPGRRRQKRQREAKSEDFARRTLLFACAVLMLICIFFTRSRAGIGTALVALACSAIVLVRARAAVSGTSRTRMASYLVFLLVIAAVVLSIMIGVAPILERLEPEALRLSTDDRMAMYQGTIRAAIDFLPFGSGLSTFSYVFPKYQLDAGFGAFVPFAHNDYLQAFLELGLAAPLAIGLLLYVYASRMIQLLRREGGRSFTLLQLAAGVGMLPLVLHSLFDFSLHIPADAMWFATLAGVMLHPGVAADEHRESEVPRQVPKVAPAEPSVPFVSTYLEEMPTDDHLKR